MNHPAWRRFCGVRHFLCSEGGEKNMNNYERAHSPFEDSAADRLRRMGLTAADGSPDRDAMAVFSTIFAGQFFDDLCDYYQDYRDVQGAIRQISNLAEQATSNQKFLLICLQYDSIYCSLPDPVWWISGSPALAELFADGFLAHLERLSQTT